MSFLMKMRDRWWVFQAWVRGRFFGQPLYMPNTNNDFHIMPGATVRRMMALMGWWGCEPASKDIAKSRILAIDLCGAPQPPVFKWDLTLRDHWIIPQADPVESG